MRRPSPPDAAEVNRTLATTADRYAALVGAELGDNLVSIVLFGSVARGEATPDSDIDLLIIGEQFPTGRFARLRSIDGSDRRIEPDLERLRERGLDPRIMPFLKTRAEAERVVPLYLDMVEDARLLYDRDGFFRSVLTRLQARLNALGAQRRRRGRIRYWVLKPDLQPGEVFEL
jgi:uncharacterized protein